MVVNSFEGTSHIPFAVFKSPLFNQQPFDPISARCAHILIHTRKEFKVLPIYSFYIDMISCRCRSLNHALLYKVLFRFHKIVLQCYSLVPTQ